MCLRERKYISQGPSRKENSSQLVSQKRFNGFLSEVWVRLRTPTRDHTLGLAKTGSCSHPGLKGHWEETVLLCETGR